MMDRTTLTQHLESILVSANKTNCYFAGGTLCIDNPHGLGGLYMIPASSVLDAKKDSFLLEDDWTIPFKLTDQQKNLFAQIYVKHKTEEHHFYKDMKAIGK